ncbi:hypothetical protein TrRE_jg1437 [Triparma retinervis]|uniref:Uncharacterized protein n=1 Tax=Triparma retinervis TaxID=2557542 RepID=A0A9W7ARJ5_9STRA|nr:hypothetical protein TrRE_jg1437 [Triparma retinervis]
MNNFLPLLITKTNKGNDGAMLSFRKKKEISSYTKFQFAIHPSVDMEKAIDGIKERVSKLLLEDSLLNINPSTKTYTRRTLSDILHPYTPPSPSPNFNSVAFSSVNTSVPVHFYLSPSSHSVFCFIDHCIADGLTMYNEVVAPIIDNPRFQLAKRPLYVPVLTEMHQMYVVARMAYLYGESLVLRTPALERTSKEQQWAAFHRIRLGQIKEVKNKLNVPVAAVIMSILIKHLASSLSKLTKSSLKICLSYAFENEASFNNYSFIILDVKESMTIEMMSVYLAKQLMGRRHEINTMYHLLQLPSGSSKVQSVVQQTICDAYIAMTMVPEGGDEGPKNIMSWMKNEHYSISTGINMTAVSIADEVHISTKVGLRDVKREAFEADMQF